MTDKEIINRLNYAANSKEDKLNLLFELQSSFDNYIKDKRDLDYSDLNFWIAQMCRCIIHEAVELTDLCNWKHWKNPKELDMKEIEEETIDLWHFLISLSLKIGLSPRKVLDKYIEKNLENYNRQLGKSLKDGYEI
jgi:dimeric dUTPase (all-alpha-NTP-PPase superfamily)